MEVALGAGEANDAIAVLRDAMPFAGASPVLLAHCGPRNTRPACAIYSADDAD